LPANYYGEVKLNYPWIMQTGVAPYGLISNSTAAGWGMRAFTPSTANRNAAITAGDYIETSIQFNPCGVWDPNNPNCAGSKVDISNIQTIYIRRSTSGPTHFEIIWDTNPAFTSAQSFGVLGPLTVTTDVAYTFSNLPANLTTGSNLYIRIVAWGATTTAGTLTLVGTSTAPGGDNAMRFTAYYHD